MARELYEAAFPLDERRSENARARVMMNPKYNFDIIINNNEFIGFLLWWDFKTLRYIEHFATIPQQRNGGSES